MTNLTPLRNFIQEPHCDLGDNAWRLADLVRTMRNKRFIDLGVRLGASSAIMSIESDERNNQVCGCDLDYDGFFKNGRRFVSENYTCYQADSVTLGKNWDEDPFDIIFVDTIHTREQVLAELYFWSNHLNKNGILISMDNGKTILERLFSNFGARKNNWRYFLPSDFLNADKKFYFGFLSNFSFVTRFGKIGHSFDNILFIIDKFIFRNFKVKKPSIIVSVYQKKV